MAEATVEKKPWWVSDEEMAGLKQTPQENMAESVVSGVPELTNVVKGDVIADYTIKDGLIVYHIYKKDRREIFLKADEAMNLERDDAKQKEIARNANVLFEQHPWWDGMESKLDQVFSEVFKYSPHKTSYYQEVDSWSVMLPEPQSPVPPSKTKLEEPIARLALLVQG